MDRTIVTCIALSEEVLDWAREAEEAWDAAVYAYENAVNDEEDEDEVARLEAFADKAENEWQRALRSVALDVLDQLREKSGRAGICPWNPIDWPRFRDLAAADLRRTLITACCASVEYRGPKFQRQYSEADTIERLTERQKKWHEQSKNRERIDADEAELGVRT